MQPFLNMSELLTISCLLPQKIHDNIFPAKCQKMAQQTVTPAINKGKGLDTCYSAAYMSQTRDQQRFTISEVAADWHKPVVPQRIMWPSIAHANGQLDPRCS